MGVSSALSGIYVMSPELYPTVLRSFGLGSCSMVSRLGGIASPYVADLVSADSWCHMLLRSVTSWGYGLALCSRSGHCYVVSRLGGIASPYVEDLVSADSLCHVFGV